jgi:hypothetical protein
LIANSIAEILKVYILHVDSIVNRGKLLHSAMNSLHNFDRSLDKFLAWLSEAESSMECVEGETDRLGGRRDPGLLRQPLHQLKVGNEVHSSYPSLLSFQMFVF